MTGLQFITHFTEKYSYLDSAMLALEGGCRWIQLRMKDASYEELKRTALAVQTECRRRKATFIIDDCVELVKEIGADGVHLGKNDMPVDQAREILGNGFIIGGTANTFDDIRMHCERGADYIGCGPFRFTTTKQKLAPMKTMKAVKTTGVKKVSRREYKTTIDLQPQPKTYSLQVTAPVGGMKFHAVEK